MGDMNWEDTERGGHLKKFFIKMLVFLLVIAIAVVAVIFLRPKKEYYNVGVTGETYCIPHLTGEGKYESGKTITISADDIPGYAFRNWTLNGEVVSTDAEYTFVVKKETSGTYIANYEAINYSVRMLGIYGAFSVTPTANVGDLIEIKDITPNEGYEAGRAYYTLDTNTEEITIVNNKFYMPAGDVRVIVEFNPITYTIEYELDEGKFEEGTTVVSTYNIKTTSFTLPKPTKFGYDFIGWTGPNLNYPTETVTIRRGSTGNRKYTANYEYHTYSITNVNGQNGTITVDSSAKYKSTVGVSVTANGGFGLSELYYILEGTDTKVPIIDNAFEMPAGNVTIYSTFSKIGYTIKLANITHGSVNIDKTSAYLGESVGIRVQADTAYRFSRSYYVVDGSVEQREFSGSFYMPGGNVTVVVEFTPEIYSLKLNLNGGKLNGVSYDGIYEYMTYTVESNRIVLPTPDEREDYEFLGWSGTDILPEGSYVLSYVIPRGSWGERTYSANWKIRTYKITFNNYDGSELLVLPAVEHGTIPQYVGTPTKPSTEEYDYIFNGWSPSLVAATKEAIYTATFTQKLHEYTITFDSCGGESVNPYIRHYNDNIGTMPTPTRRGYNLEGWFTRAEGGAQMIASDKVTADATYYAHWSLVEYTVEIDLAGGSFSGQTSFTYNVTSEDIAIQRPSKTGYTFTGFTGTELSEKTLDVTIAQGSVGNRVYLATYEAIKYTIKWLNYDGSTLLEEQVAYDTMPEYSGEKPTKPRDTEYSYVFNNVWQPAITKVTGNASYTAQFEAVTNGYTISFDSRGGSDVHEITKDYNKEIGTLPIPTFDGYTFDGWYTAVTGGDKLTETTKVTEDKTYYAHWSVITYTISYSLDGGTGTGVTSYTVETETFTLFTPTKTGYAFVGWTGTDLTSATVEVVIEKGSIGNRSYTANWSQSAFNISKGTVTNGTIDAPANAFMGATVTITATPAEGYEVSNYYYIAAGSTEKVTATNGSFTMPASDVTVYAEFVKATFTITIADTTNGLVKSSKTSATMGEEITLTITADNGYFANSVSYRLAGSTQDITITNSKFTMPASNITVYVVFGFRNYTITKGTIANGTLTVPDTAKYKDTVTVTATPATGYELTALYYYLEGDNTTKITVTDNKFTMPASNITIYAEFTAMTKVTVDIEGTIRSFPCAKGAKLEDILPEDLNEHNTSGYYTEDESGDRTYYDASYVVTGDITLKTHLATLDKLTFTADNASSPTSYSVKGSDNTATSIVIPKLYNNLPVKAIAEAAFSKYEKLTKLEMSNTIELIGLKGSGESTWARIINDSLITSIYLSENVKTIYPGAFSGVQLTSIKVSKNNTSYKVVNDCLLTFDGESLIAGCSGDITIPSSVKTIEAHAFDQNMVTSITFNEVLETINSYAFYKNKLSQITFPLTLKEIGGSAFAYGSLEEVVFNEGLEDIREDAFTNGKIKDLNIPKTVKIIEKNPFKNIGYLETITVVEGNSYYKSVDNCLLTIDGEYLITGCKNSAIPNTVKEIKEYAFANVNLRKINIPNGVERIEKYAFFEVPLDEVFLPSSISEVGLGAFMTLESLVTVYLNNTYCYTNADGGFYDDLGQVLGHATKVYVLASVDDGSNAYLSDTTKFPYVYAGIMYNGNTYKLYSKEKVELVTVTLTVDGVEHTYDGFKNSTLASALPEEYNEYNTSGYYIELDNGDRDYYDGDYVLTAPISLTTHVATLDKIRFSKLGSGYKAGFKNTSITGDYVIPRLYDGLPVIQIESRSSYSFGSSKTVNITSIEYPSSITFIGSNALTDTKIQSLFVSKNIVNFNLGITVKCNELKSIKVDTRNAKYKDYNQNCVLTIDGKTLISGTKNTTEIPSGVTKIENDAFHALTSLRSIIITEGVTTIGHDAFAYTGLTQVVLPKSLTKINWRAFMNCYGLTKITVAEGNITYKSVNDNCVLSADGTKLITWTKEVTIPDTVTSIESYGAITITDKPITLPSGLKRIEMYAFSFSYGYYSASAASPVILPEGLEYIGTHGIVLWDISELYLPSSITELGSNLGTTIIDSVDAVYINNTYCYENVLNTDTTCFRFETEVKKVYVLASVDDGTNTYLKNTANFPYKYTGVVYNGKTYNLYSKEEFNQRITMLADGSRRTYFGNNGQALSTFLPEELNEHNTSGYYSVDANGVRTYYDASYIVTEELELRTYTATFDGLKFTADNTSNPTYYCVERSSSTVKISTKTLVIPKYYNGLPVKVVGKVPYENGAVYTFEIPNTVEVFAPEIMYHCSSLYLPDSVKAIGTISNLYGNNINKVSLPPTLEKINAVVSGNSVTYSATIENPFKWSNYLDSIELRGESENFKVVNNCLLSKDGKTLISGTRKSIIPDGVTIIGISAFEKINPSTLTLPDGLERIEDNAFKDSNCGGIAELVCPSTLKYIGQRAFSNISSKLTKITLNESLETLNYSSFEYAKITEINIPAECTINGVISYEYSNPFRACKNLVSITVSAGSTKYKVVDNCLLTIDGKDLIFGCNTSIIPSSVETIGYLAFSGVQKDEITIPENVKTIEHSAFFQSSIKTVYFSAGLTKCASGVLDDGISTIYINNSYTYSLTYYYSNKSDGLISASASIKLIYVLASADDGSNTYISTTNYPYKYTGVVYKGNTYNLYSKEKLDTYAITLTVDGVEHTYDGTRGYTLSSAIPEEFNEHNTSGYYIELDNGDRDYYDADYVIMGPISLTTHKATLDHLSFTPDDESNPTYYKVKGTSVVENAVIPKLYNNKPVKELPDDAFWLYKYKSVEMPVTIETIGRGALYAIGLTSLYIPQNVKTITDYNPAWGNEDLAEIKVDSKNQYFTDMDSNIIVGKATMRLVTGSKNCTIIPDGIKVIGQNAYYGFYNLGAVVLPNTVEEIEFYAFNGCGITSINLPEGLTKIGSMSLMYLRAESITLPESLTTIESDAFGYGYLKSIHIPKNLTQMYDNAFYDCPLTSITVDSENKAFYTIDNNCLIKTGTKELLIGTKDTVIPSDIKSIGTRAFYRIKEITNITIPESCTSISAYAFEGTKLTSVTIPASISRYVGQGAFDIDTLKTVYIDSSQIYKAATKADIHTVGGLLKNATRVYILASVDDGSNTYLSNTTNYPYKYTGMTYNGKTYNVYSKEQAYSVTHSRSDGKVAVNGLQSKYFSGDTVKFSFSFGDYYELSSYTISGGVTATKSGANYTFTMPSKNCTISATAKRKSGLTNIYFISIKIMNGYTYDQVMRAGGTTEFGYEYDANDKGHSTGFFLKAPYKLNKVEVYNGSTQTYSFEGSDQVKAFANDAYAFWVDVNWKTLNYDPIYYLYITT